MLPIVRMVSDQLARLVIPDVSKFPQTLVSFAN